ncbi:MAG TPA: hydrogenase iron-sulfur subunit [candidate division Zixibacteria bacterium]|nr:hydrogenase iron-sulfur subunit [candidate division Zixibacteria bacterium]
MTDMVESDKNTRPSILVFATNNISDPGIDLAGSSHMAYPTSVKVIAVPCSSGIDPRWVLHALTAGFDGVFIAADGTDCAYLPNCTERTGQLVKQAQQLLEKNGHDPRRLKMAAICSVCAESFVAHIESFQKALSNM